MKTVGTRRIDTSALEDQGGLARTATALRGTGFAPRSVYRFRTCEEAEAWMLEMMLRSRERQRQSPKISPASAAR